MQREKSAIFQAQKDVEEKTKKKCAKVCKKKCGKPEKKLLKPTDGQKPKVYKQSRQKLPQKTHKYLLKQAKFRKILQK